MISLAKLKAALRITASTDDGYLVDLEVQAVSFVERETGRYFGAVASVTEYLIGGGTDTLFLSEAPAAPPTTVTERTYPGGDATTITAADADGYVLRGTMKLVRKGGGIWARGYEYEVTYDRGYAAEAEPGEIRMLVTDLVAYWYEERVPVASLGSGAEPLPLHASKILASWRRRPWA